MSESTNRIWQPVVEQTDTHLPHPGSSNIQQFYTKTSLAADETARRVCHQNREISSASQAYNNTAKPFSRQGGQYSSLPSLFVPQAGQAFSSASREKLQQQQQTKLENNQRSDWRSSDRCIGNSREYYEEQARQEENMAPQKIVHKQYNSPIDLYSMNNIRKTIEAHTELIAPGIKGINFMKPDAPVNKQSEVYKLVMEEEQRSHSQQGSSARLSPISGQPINIPTALSAEQANQRAQAETMARHSSRRVIEQQRSDSYQHQEQHRDAPATESSGSLAPTAEAGPAPTCCECGQYIVGPFAKIQNRFVHPQCFNCTTCGTSLKNTGYFTVNEKLYCEIHAKQVANMMHIQYDFGGKQVADRQYQAQVRQSAQIQQSTLTNHQQEQMHQQKQHHSLSSSGATLGSRQLAGSMSATPATISTMFADRSANNESNADYEKREARWAWRPVTSKDRSVAQTSMAAAASMRSNYQHQEQEQQSVASLQMSQDHHHQQSSFSFRSGTKGRGLVQESSLHGSRIPVCVHCHVQIQGPYILAGKTTWCKLCSQSNFNCCSCRRSLLDIGFIEDSSHKYYCEHCFEAYCAPVCSKCNLRVKGDCLNALNKQWHPSCFVCGHCRRPFGNSSFYLEDNVPYCERDWNVLFTTKCYACSYPIEAGDKWIEALERNYHSTCFKCTSCQANLEGSTFYCKGGKPYCRLHAR